MADEPSSTVIAVITFHSDGMVTSEQWDGSCGACVAFLRHFLGKPKASTMQNAADHEKVHGLLEQAGLVVVDGSSDEGGPERS